MLRGATILLASAVFGAVTLGAAEPVLLAEPELIVKPDPLVRPGIAFRCRVASAALIPEAATVTVAILDGERVLAASQITLASPTQLAVGVALVLIPSEAATAPRLEVRVADGTQQAVARISRILVAAGDGGVLARERARLTGTGSGTATRDPLPWLWYEQAQELSLTPVPTVAMQDELRRILTRLSAWPQAEPETGATRLLAFRDPIDASVQPARLTRFSQVAAGAPLVVVLRPQVVTKSVWEPLPSRWLAAAAEARVAVLEVYPAGDLAFAGAARRRLPLAVVLARANAPDLGPELLVTGDDRLAEAAGWKSPSPPPVTAPPRGRLAAWATGPFVIVIGTGEHRAARADARRLAAAFVRAWAAHAHGLPPVVEDTAFRAADWPGHHLVLIGSPRGNAVLRGFAAHLAVTWDDRVLRLGAREFLRTRQPGLALAQPLPGAAGLTMLILDGSPAWSAAPGVCPLAAEAADADLIVRPGDGDAGPGVRLLLESPADLP